MVKLKWLKDWKERKEGDISNVAKKSAENFVSQGYAEYHCDEEEVKNIVTDKTKKKDKELVGKALKELEKKAGLNEEKAEEKSLYTEEQKIEALKRFEEKDLILKIKEELDKKHFGDNKEKLTLNLCHTSGLISNGKRRMSCELTANSSDGKDNMQLTSLSILPRNSWRFFTSGTQAAMEDDVEGIPIIAFSEVNLREGGANRHMLEVMKQMTEGGTSAIKKDIGQGMKVSKHVTGEQKSVSYGTTEAEGDTEMETRFIKITLQGAYEKNKHVNDKTLEHFSDEDLILRDADKTPTWVEIGLSEFWKEAQENKIDIVLPYAKLLQGQIDGEDIFDHENARSKRDLKRLLCLTCAMAFLYQKQRQKKKVGDTTFIISEPFDFLQTLEIASEFFNQTYTGLDARLTEVLNAMKKWEKETNLNWIPRDYVQKETGKSLNTIKTWCGILAGEGVIKGSKGCQLNQEESANIYDGNKIYYERCQKGVKKVLIRCQLSKIEEYFEKNGFDTLTPFKIEKNKEVIDDKNA